MAQIIKNRRGSLDRLSSATGSLQKGEILIATGSSKLTGVTNGQGLVFAAVESGSVVAANRVLQGATAPIFSASSYGHMLDGVPFYASSSNTLFLLGADGNTTPDLTGNISTFSSSVATSFSASAASIASVTGDFSSSVATSFSASNASVTALSASTYGAVFGFAGLSSSIATTNSASAATTAANLNTYSASAATTDSASAASQTALSGAVATTIAGINSVNATFATTGSNTFKGNQIVSGTFDLFSVSSSFKIEGNGFGQTYFNGGGALVLNPGYGGVEVVGVNNSFKAANITADGTLSASVITGIGNVTEYSSSVNSRFSASAYNVAELSASVASVGGTFSSSVATSFSASYANVSSLSASIAVTDNSQTNRIVVLESSQSLFDGAVIVSGSGVGSKVTIKGDLLVQGTQTTVDSTTINLADNVLQLNAAGTADGGIVVRDATGGSTTSGSLLWDVTADYWKAGKVGSEAKVLVAVGDNVFSSSIQTSISGTFGYSDFSSSLATTDSASAYQIAALSASVASVTGTFSSSVATSFSASAASITSVSASLSSVSGAFATSTSASNYQITELSASVASVGGTFSSSVATDFSASTAARVALSASIASTDSTQTNNIATLTSKTGSYATTGSNVFNGDQVLTGSFDMTGTLNVNNAVAVNDSNMNLGNSSSLNLTGGSSIYVAGAGTISGSIVGIGNVTLYSASVNSRFSASAYDISVLSASVASVGGTFSSSVATDFSASNAARVALSASIASDVNTLSSSIYQTDATQSNAITNNSASFATSISASNYNITINSASLSSVSSSFATSTSASNYQITELSASVASVGGTFSSSVATDFSASTAARVALSASIASDINTLSTSVDSRLDAEEFKSTTFATTGSNTFKGEQIISSSLLVTNEIKGTGSIFLQPNSTDSRKIEIYNTGASDVHIKGTAGLTFLGDDTNYVAINDSAQTITITGVNGVFVSSSLNVTGSISSSVGISGSINGIGNVTDYSSSVNSRFSASAYDISVLSASVASVGGTFSSSVATDFSASTAARVALSASIATTDNSQTDRIGSLESYSSSLKSAIELTGSSVTIQGDLLVRGTTTSVNSTTIDLGDNIINLNGTGATNGGLYVKDVTAPNTATGSLLWDSTNDYWKAGTKNSESKVLLAIGDNVVSGGAQIAIADLDGYSTFNDNIYVDINAASASAWGAFQSASSYSSSAATAFSASTANVNSISGAFATSTSASNYQITELSASVASVGGTFSSSVATSFSASYASVSALSASIYLTDATQSTNITNNSSSFATSVSASNFRITTLETTIDGGSF